MTGVELVDLAGRLDGRVRERAAVAFESMVRWGLRRDETPVLPSDVAIYADLLEVAALRREGARAGRGVVA